MTLLRKILLLSLVAIVHSAAVAQQHNVQVLTPERHQEFCLGTEVPVRVHLRNPDSVARTLDVSVGFRNIGSLKLCYWREMVFPNVPPGAEFDTSFPTFTSNPSILSQLGTFDAIAALNIVDSSGRVLTDWKFIDTTSYHVFGIRRIAQPFIDAASNYSSYDTPDQTKWVSMGATVVEGDSETWDPPPPNDPDIGYGRSILHSPVIKMDRHDGEGHAYSGSDVGDTLTSFPINILGYTHAAFTFDFERGSKTSRDTQSSNDNIAGPDIAVKDAAGRVISLGDSLILEFMDPLEADCNGQLWHEIFALGGGRDLGFHSLSLSMDTAFAHVGLSNSRDTTVALGRNYFSSNFRFRLRLAANDGSNSVHSLRDDVDPWYLDNIVLQIPRHTELEATWARAISPYTKVPKSCIGALPVLIRVKNYAGTSAPDPRFRVTITDRVGAVVYDSSLRANIRGYSDTVLEMPAWDASLLPPGAFTVTGRVDQPGYDSYEDDDICISHFYLNYEAGSSLTQEFGYDDAGIDPKPGAGNDLRHKQAAAGFGFNNATGSFAMRFELPHRDTVYGPRIFFANDNQSPDAIGIELRRNDTITGLPGDTIAGVESTFEDVRRGGFFNHFWSYYFLKPLVLQAGTYWITVSQLTTDNFTMGGDNSRGAALLCVQDSLHPSMSAVFSDPYGTQETATMNTGDISHAFAYETPAGSNNWQSWMPDEGTWPTASAHPTITTSYFDLDSSIESYRTYLPMIRVLVGRVMWADVSSSEKTTVNSAAWPNPFNPLVSTVHLDSHGATVIYNLLGVAMRRLPTGSTTWDGRDERAHPLPQGHYFWRDETGAVNPIEIRY